MNDEADRWTLIWADSTERPDPRLWKIGLSYNEQTAAYWSSLAQAIGYATGMTSDRASGGLYPWIRTPQGHVYSPAAIKVMGSLMLDGSGRRR